ncbi:hypothetical protein ACFLQ0_03685 [Nitrospinota bacterium]
MEMFENATFKVEEARVNLENLINSQDTHSFRSAFNSFLSNARAITNALQKDGKLVAGFSDWYGQKQTQMRGDPLLRFIHEARTEDFHRGKHRLTFPRTEIQYFSTEDVGDAPTEDACIGIGAQGPMWIIGKGTPREQRIPIRGVGSWRIEVAIKSPPSAHLGQKLERQDPVTICILAIKYLEDLVIEAKTKLRSPCV